MVGGGRGSGVFGVGGGRAKECKKHLHISSLNQVSVGLGRPVTLQYIDNCLPSIISTSLLLIIRGGTEKYS